jgi:hypothetical protein
MGVNSWIRIQLFSISSNLMQLLTGVHCFLTSKLPMHSHQQRLFHNNVDSPIRISFFSMMIFSLWIAQA